MSRCGVFVFKQLIKEIDGNVCRSHVPLTGARSLITNYFQTCSPHFIRNTTHKHCYLCIFSKILESRENLLHRHFGFRSFFMNRLHVAAGRWWETLRTLLCYPFRVGVRFPARWVRVRARVGPGVRVLGCGGIGAGGGSLRRVDEGVEAGSAARGWAVITVEVEAVQALQVAPVVAHREREARALHGARACAAAEGLRAAAARHCRCHLGLRSMVTYGGRRFFITIVVLHIIMNRRCYCLTLPVLL